MVWICFSIVNNWIKYIFNIVYVKFRPPGERKIDPVDRAIPAGYNFRSGPYSAF